jgi:hypothetical protein
MEKRKERNLYEGPDRREAERRKGERRKSGQLQMLLKYLAVALLAAIVWELIRH